MPRTPEQIRAREAQLNKIIELRREKRKTGEIAKIIGLATKTTERILTELKEEGRL